MVYRHTSQFAFSEFGIIVEASTQSTGSEGP